MAARFQSGPEDKKQNKNTADLSESYLRRLLSSLSEVNPEAADIIAYKFKSATRFFETAHIYPRGDLFAYNLLENLPDENGQRIISRAASKQIYEYMLKCECEECVSAKK